MLPPRKCGCPKGRCWKELLGKSTICREETDKANISSSRLISLLSAVLEAAEFKKRVQELAAMDGGDNDEYWEDLNIASCDYESAVQRIFDLAEQLGT